VLRGGRNLAYIYIRGEFPEGAQILEKALAEARAKGFLGRTSSAPDSTARSTFTAARALTSAARRLA
jgi:hypothetical protein